MHKPIERYIGTYQTNQASIFYGLTYKNKNVLLIPGSVRKQLGSGIHFFAVSGFNEYGSETLILALPDCPGLNSRRR